LRTSDFRQLAFLSRVAYNFLCISSINIRYQSDLLALDSAVRPPDGAPTAVLGRSLGNATRTLG
jgi:hypothetical protein